MNDEQEIAKKEQDSESLRAEAVGTEATFVPQVDIIEKKNRIEILADMPGVSRRDVDAVIEEGILTIKGRVEPNEEENMNLESGEYEYGNFYRSFAVGEGLDTEGIEAGINDGVLKLTIPKSEKYKPKQIEIR